MTSRRDGKAALCGERVPAAALRRASVPAALCGALFLAGCVSRTEVFEDRAPPSSGPTCEGNPVECAFPELPELSNVRARVDGDTVRVSFAGLSDAQDYRIYAPNPDDVVVTERGRVVVRNAVYRCAGNRQFQERSVGNSLRGNPAGVYTRREVESVVGHVYLEPARDRVAVRRLADPRADADSSFLPPAIAASRSARYVVEGAAADALIELGYRDDGIAFYVPSDWQGTHPLYFWESGPRPSEGDRRLSLYVPEGPERDAMEGAPLRELFEAELRVLDEPDGDSVPLTRIFYAGGHDHDVLAAGDAELTRLLEQGNTPLFSVTWPGLRAPTTLVVEALDAGCPYAGRVVPDVVAGLTDEGASTLDEARLASEESFINGQHDPQSRPDAIARSFVDVAPAEAESFDSFENFDDGATWGTLSEVATSGELRTWENDAWLVEAASMQSFSVGALLGQLWLATADDGGPGLVWVSPKSELELRAASYVHVSLPLTLPATPRRYPVLGLRGEAQSLWVRVAGVTGAPLGQALELELMLCAETEWRPNATCPRTELSGRRRGDASDPNPWSPVPVLGELAGFDWPVKLDVYASTQRVFLFIDERPAGCGSVPTGALREGSVRISFGSVSNDSKSDEATVDETSPHQYLRAHSPGRDARLFDRLGLEGGLGAPDWPSNVVPCGGEWSP